MAHGRQSTPGPGGPPHARPYPLAATIFRLAHVPSPKTWLAYTVAIVATILATALRWWLGSLVGQKLPPFITFYPLVMFAALFGGIGPGLLATALASLVVPYFFLPPTRSLAVAHPADELALVLFIGINLAVSLVCGALRSARHRTFAEARRAEDSERRLRATFQQAAVGILEVDTQDRITAANQRAHEILGYPPDQLVGLLIHDLTHPDDRPRSDQLNRDIHQARRSAVEYEKRYLRRDGSPIWVRVAVAPLRDAQGRDRGSVGTFEDITARKQAEEALRQSEERFSAFMRHLPGATWMKDAAGRYVYANPEAERIFSRPWHALRGKTDEELFPPETARQFRENDHRALVEGGKLQTTEVLRQVDGLDHHSIISKFAVLGPDGQPAYVGGVAFDITDRILAEQALRQTKDDLAHANADLERKVQQRTAKLEETVAELEHFSYTITHDMRAPLRAMTGYAGMLTSLHAQALNDQGRDLLRRISESALRMDQLITDALQYSRVVRDQLPLQPLDPAAAIRGIVESYPQFQPPHARITVQPEMPRVLGNAAALTQIFSNLLGNAVKFVTPGHVPQITVTAAVRPSILDDPSAVASARADPPSTPEWVRLCVADNGIGIPPEYHHKVWQMFQRLSKAYEGTGIGLALVRKVVERMGGRVGVESSPGQGSRFWVELQKAP